MQSRIDDLRIMQRDVGLDKIHFLVFIRTDPQVDHTSSVHVVKAFKRVLPICSS